jgi:AraC-like DNA-binding protein
MSSGLLERYEVIRTSNIDVACEKLGQILTPHRLELVDCPGSLNVRVYSFRARNMSVNLVNYGAEVRIVQPALENYYAVVVPLSGQIGVCTGGDHIDLVPGTATVLSPMDSVKMRWTSDCRALVVRVEKTALEAKLSDLIGGPLSDPLWFAPRMDVAYGRGLSWHCMLMHLVEEIDRPNALVATPHGIEPFEHLLMMLLLKAQENNYSGALKQDANRMERGSRSVCPQYIREVRRLLDDHPEWDHTTESLANYVGYTVRAVQKGFREHVGSSPIAYLRRVRLLRVRDELLAASPDSTTVDAVAQRWGFSHHGRFAGLYRNEFGETPRTTLRR